MNTTKPRALSRTWAAHTTYRECGVVVSVAAYAVTISRTCQGFTAEVDGQPVDVLQADRILRAADQLAEVLDTIGKPAACNLRRELGRLGFQDHYQTAANAFGRPVASLAALSPEDAYTVRNYARGQWGLTA